MRPHVAEAGAGFTPAPRTAVVLPAERIDPAAGFLEIVLQPHGTNA